MKQRDESASLEDRQKLAKWIAQSPAMHVRDEVEDVLSTDNPRSIAFGKEMIRAILDRRKTQTRRIVRTDRFGNPSRPPASAGETLWVRERFAPVAGPDGIARFVYAADGTSLSGSDCRWRMSIHMPRRASRLSVQVVAVRSEQLQKISDVDLLAEGYPPDRLFDPRRWFADLWDRLTPEGAKWADNPTVWVLEFTPCESFQR